LSLGTGYLVIGCKFLFDVFREKMKHLLFLVLALFISISGTRISYAGPPFGTDDPEPVGFRHWEYYLSSMDQFQPGFATGTLPHFEFNYGLIRGCQIHCEIPMNYSLTRDKEFQYGYAYTEVGFKYRFFKSKDGSFQAGTFPIFEIPTVKNTNFGNNKMQVYLPVWVQKSWGRFTTYGGGGYWINPGNGNKNWIYAGWEAQYDISKRFTLGGELYYKSPPADGTRSYVGFNTGGFVNFSENFHFIWSIGHSIGGNTTTAYAGFLITI
jgi:hypothetical protein